MKIVSLVAAVMLLASCSPADAPASPVTDAGEAPAAGSAADGTAAVDVALQGAVAATTDAGTKERLTELLEKGTAAQKYAYVFADADFQYPPELEASLQERLKAAGISLPEGMTCYRPICRKDPARCDPPRPGEVVICEPGGVICDPPEPCTPCGPGKAC